MQTNPTFKSFPGEINQDNLDELLAFHKLTFGSWRMKEPDDTDDEEDAGEDKSEDSQEENEQEQEAAEEDDSSEDDEDESHESSLTLEDARKALKKTRTENASWRTKHRDLEAKLADAKTPEQVEELVGQMKTEREAGEHALVVENVALKHKLPDDLAKVLGEASAGKSREELDAHAKTLAKYAPKDDEGPDPDDLEGGLGGGNDDDGSFDPTAHAKKIRAQRWR